MTRIPLAFLVFATACGGAPAARPVANRAVSTSHFTLQPLRLHGGEGMHSASQSWTTVGGTLDLTGTRVTLRLDFATSRSFIHCPPGWDSRTSMQACAPPDAKDSISTTSVELGGEMHLASGRWRGELAGDGGQRLVLSCTETAPTLGCTIENTHSVFGSVGDQPGELVFAREVPAKAVSYL